MSQKKNKKNQKNQKKKDSADKLKKAIKKKELNETPPPEMVDIPEKRQNALQKAKEKLIGAKSKHSSFCIAVAEKEAEFIDEVEEAQSELMKLCDIVVKSMVGEVAFDEFNWIVDLESGVLKRNGSKAEKEDQEGEDDEDEDDEGEDESNEENLPVISLVKDKEEDQEETEEQEENKEAEPEPPETPTFADLTDTELVTIAMEAGISVLGLDREKLIAALEEKSEDDNEENDGE